MEENTIITKQDERNALAKIRKIINGLGENSYVASAFDGAFALAEQNIVDGEIIEDHVKEAGRAEQTADNYINKKRTGGGDGV